MKRSAVAVIASLLALGCYHDNASPFVHGGGNKPPNWGSTWASASGPRSSEATPNPSYSASSGYAGGYEKSGNGNPAPAPVTPTPTAPSTPQPAASR